MANISLWSGFGTFTELDRRFYKGNISASPIADALLSTSLLSLTTSRFTAQTLSHVGWDLHTHIPISLRHSRVR